LSFDEDVRSFERATESGDSAEVVRLAPAMLRFMRVQAAVRDLMPLAPAEIAAQIDRALGGLAGLFQVQEALRCYIDRPSGPVELRLNGVYQNAENDSVVAIFDDADKAMAYYNSALLPDDLRFTDSGGYFRSFRSDSLCYDKNPTSGGLGTEGGVLCRALPWNNYNGIQGFFGSPPPPRNPPPLTGPLPPTPSDARPRQQAATT